MNDLSVIDRFLDVFSRYIDSGFGLLGGEVAFLTATLVVIDMTLAGLFWAMGGQDDVIAKLIKKVLYVGAFAFIITNFNALAGILFNSFAGLGLTASGGTVTQAEFLQNDRKFNPTAISPRRAERPGAGMQEVPDCAQRA